MGGEREHYRRFRVISMPAVYPGLHLTAWTVRTDTPGKTMREGEDMEKFEDFEIDRGEFELTRREFLITSTAAAAIAVLPRGYGAQPASAQTVPPTLMKVT